MTFETTFAGVPSGFTTPLISYAAGDADGNDFYIDINADGSLFFAIAGTSRTVAPTNYDYTTLLNGEKHSFAFSWSNEFGGYAIFVDGVRTDDGTKAMNRVLAGSAGNGELVFGNDQDSIGGGFEARQAFQGTFYDVRIWDHFLEVDAIQQYQDQKIDSATPPEGLIANWQFDEINGMNQIVDVIGTNHLIVDHATGTDFVASTPITDLNVDENASDTTHVGYVIPTDSGTDAAESFTFALTDASGIFAIDSNTGAITVADGSQLNFEVAQSHDVFVEVTDAAGITYGETTTIIVNNLNEFTPAIDLNGAAIGNDNSITFTEGDFEVNVAPAATIDDFGEADITQLSVQLGGFGVDAQIDEYIRLDSQLIFPDASSTGTFTVGTTTLDYTYDHVSMLLNIVNAAGATVPIPQSELQTLIQTIQFQNGSENPLAGDRTFEFTATDSGGNSSVVVTATVTVQPVNDAPRGVDNTIVVDENGAHFFVAEDFEFIDDESDNLQSVIITTTPNSGALIFNGTVVTDGQEILAADIADLLYFTEPGASGDGIGNFTFEVRDDGGTEFGGVDLDPAANTIIINVTDVNDPPVIDNLDGDIVEFTAGSTQTFLDLGADALVSDVDSPNFDGGSLVVTINSAVVADDSLVTVSTGTNAGEISVSGAFVSYEGTQIGFLLESNDPAAQTETLTFALNANADAEAVSALIKAIAYENSNAAATDSTRIVDFTLSDGDGGTSTVSSVTINVAAANLAPDAAISSENYIEDTTTTINLSGTDDDGTVTGIELFNLPNNGTLYLDAALQNEAVANTTYATTSESLTLYFVPDADFNGDTSFEFSAIDNDGAQSDTRGSVSLSGEAVNDAPTTSYCGTITDR